MAVTPSFQNTLSSASYVKGAAAVALNGAATVTDGGTVGYQWQRSTNNSTWTNISGATGATYTPPTSAVGTVYYRVIATNRVSALYPTTNLYPATNRYPNVASSASATSGSAAITVTNPASTPVFSKQPVSASYNQGASAAALTVAASATYGAISYQWQRSANNSTWTNISGATGANYTPSTSTGGAVYYRAVATSILDGTTASANSDAALITVYTASAPIWQQNPAAASYFVGDAPVPLTAKATAPRGTIAYQWQSSPNGSSWTAISGATGERYTPSASAAGVTYYRTVATNTVGTSSASSTSNSAAVTVYGASQPVFSLQPADGEYGLNDPAAPLTAKASAERGTISYQWQTSVDGVSWTDIPGAVGESYTPATSAEGTVSYRVAVTNTVGTSTASANSNSAAVTVYTAAPPVFTKDLVSASYDAGASPAALDGTATVLRGSLSYQWQKSRDAGTWENIPGAVSPQYTPPTSAGGTLYYRVIATNTVGTSTDSATSNLAAITVYVAVEPVFSLQPESAVYYENAVPTPMTAQAAAPHGTISYQWQESADGESWTDIPGATSASWTPATGAAGRTFYRVKATNTVGNTSASGYSQTAQITILAAQAPVFLAPLENGSYTKGLVAKKLDGRAETGDGGTITYQWYRGESVEGPFTPIAGANDPQYRPGTLDVGTLWYYVTATNTKETSSRTARSNLAQIVVKRARFTPAQQLLDYRRMVQGPFIKLCRLRFLQPDGSTAFALDNNPRNQRNVNFITQGTIHCNLQNGRRRTAEVTLGNLDGEFDFNVNRVWFGQEIAIDEGLILSDGSEYYLQQGIFLPVDPVENLSPANRTMTYPLTDKWAMVDGSLGGRLEGTYQVEKGTAIFPPIAALLAEDRGNGRPVDNIPPVFTEYYNGKTQTLPEGGTAALTDAPYTLTMDGGGSKAEVILGLTGMVNAWVGYDPAGALRVDPSQDDLLDSDKPVEWQFSMSQAKLLGAAYQSKNTEVYNDYIVVGELLGEAAQPKGRAQNLDPASDTNIRLIGRKTFWMQAPGYGTDAMCRDLAAWKLKRAAAMQKAVTISCGQLFHIRENSLVTIVRTDKPGSPVERHLVMGFSRPLSWNGEMTINAVSVQDLPIATVV